MKPLIVGESNPYGGDDYYALYPAPDGCSGHRLCRLVLWMSRHKYLDVFDRCNLVRGKWSIVVARASAREMLSVDDGRKLILLGSKVSSAFGTPYEPFSASEVGGHPVLVLPHPSGLCRAWGVQGAYARARECLKEFAPEVAQDVGVYPGEWS